MGEDMNQKSIEELLCMICPDITIRELLDLEKEDSQRIAEEVVDLFKEKFKKAKLKFQELNFIDEKFNGMKSAYHDELRGTFLREINNLKFKFDKESSEKINILMKAAFILGSDTTSSEYYRIVRLSKIMKELQTCNEKGLNKGRNTKKHNELLANEIRKILRNNPSMTHGEIISSLKYKADNGLLKTDSHDIFIISKGSVYRDKILKSESFVFERMEGTTEYRKFNPVSVRSVGRYCAMVKKGEW